MLLAGCNHDELAVVNDGENPIKAGEQILFTSMLPDEAGATRSKKSEWEEEVKKYSPVNHDYTFSVTMWKKDAATASGTSTYKPLQTTDVGSSDISGYDGTLKVADGATPLYWPDNVNEWGFTAEANHSTLESDQSTQEKWLAMDYLKGHSYLPVWTGEKESGSGTDPDSDTPMYLTSKEWYKTNQRVKDLEGLMVSSPEDYKKIPLYMQHQRAWITVILRAGEGVTREALAFEKAAENIRMAINSYTKNGSEYTKQEVGQPWASEYFIDYGKDANGEAATHVSTTRYDAIVEPHKYGERKDEDVIAKINLSNQNFSFYASNDTRYINDPDDEEWKEAYNLEAGKHLTIEVTLSRESRKILITAWIEDWTEVVTSTICDDYGQNGDPVVIKNRAELIAFLTDPKKNCQGSVGIIQPNELALDVEGEPWTGTYDLNATLNLAGCKLVTGHRIFKSMTSSANLVNGTVSITDGAALDCAIALKNEGTIERVQVVTSGENSTAKATLAGMVGLNTGTIYQCSSTLPVYATTATDIEGTTLSGYVGGIAAVSQAVDNTSMAVIDGCTVNASVNGTGDIKGGGIVGYATGRISNNLFEYGITVKQNATNFKNIFGMAGNIDLRAYNNRWPTKATNPINDSESSADTNPNNYPGTKFDAVIDCENELDYVIKTTTLNVQDYNYRISKSFAVSSDTWTHGRVIDDSNSTENILFNLDGNDKTITLTGNKTVTVWSGSKPEEGTSSTYTTAPMLFNYVKGEIKDLTLYLEKPIVAEPSVSDAGEYNATDAIAPLAYAVYGTDAKLSNIKVKAHKTDGSIDVYIQAATPAGLVVWAFGGATVTHCKVQVPVQMWLPSNVGTQGRHYAGGIVACAAKASIRESVYLVQSNNALGSAAHATGANHYYGGIVGGTSKKDTETPSLQIADCTSWFAPISGETGVGSRGSVIGFACYTQTDQGSALANGMDPNKKSEGNWWPLNTVGAYTRASGLAEEMVIGKRNAVSPTHEDL